MIFSLGSTMPFQAKRPWHAFPNVTMMHIWENGFLAWPFDNFISPLEVALPRSREHLRFQFHYISMVIFSQLLLGRSPLAFHSFTMPIYSQPYIGHFITSRAYAFSRRIFSTLPSKRLRKRKLRKLSIFVYIKWLFWFGFTILFYYLYFRLASCFTFSRHDSAHVPKICYQMPTQGISCRRNFNIDWWLRCCEERHEPYIDIYQNAPAYHLRCRSLLSKPSRWLWSFWAFIIFFLFSSKNIFHYAHKKRRQFLSGLTNAPLSCYHNFPSTCLLIIPAPGHSH